MAPLLLLVFLSYQTFFQLYYRRQYVMLGQAQLTLRDVINFTKKNKFDINFLEKIKVNRSCDAM